MIAILDYGSGNLRSAERAFARAHSDVRVTSDIDLARTADGLVVPGVGAFGACISQFEEAGAMGLIEDRIAHQLPTIGICVGMQIFFSQGREKDAESGLSLWSGEVTELSAPVLPHIGWNTVEASADSKLFSGIENERFYFVHSFAAKVAPTGTIAAYTNYGETFVAALESPYLVATQFHPEKSGDAGLALISNWVQNWIAA